MTDEDKKSALKEYGFPVLCILICYALLIVGRDFRDNFTIEIWNEISVGWVSSVLSKTEMITGFIVLIVVASLAFIKNNLIGFRMTNLVIFTGVVMSGVSSFLFEMHLISGFYWMLTIGTGMFLAFTVIQSALFDRMIASVPDQGQCRIFRLYVRKYWISGKCRTFAI